jgi:hypothetical protein
MSCTDEAVFTRRDVHNIHNLHEWATQNPHVVRHSTFQKNISVNVWAGTVDDYVIRPYTRRHRLGGGFLEERPQLCLYMPMVSAWWRSSRFYRQSAQLAVDWSPSSRDLTPLDIKEIRDHDLLINRSEVSAADIRKRPTQPVTVKVSMTSL